MFDDILFHDELKEILIKIVNKEVYLNILLYGDIATAKTLFLLELKDNTNSILIDKNTTEVGLINALFFNDYDILLIDQLDNLDKKLHDSLLNILEHGIITKTYNKTTAQKRLKISCIATANNINKIGRQLLSRFMLFRFNKYTVDQYKQVCEVKLKKMGASEEMIKEIFEFTKESRDIRKALQIFQACHNDINLFNKIKNKIIV